MVSRVPPLLAIMCGRGTLAVVVSSPCRNTAIISEIVRMACSNRSSELPKAAGIAALAMVQLFSKTRISARGGALRRSRRPLLRVDLDLGRETCEQRPARLAVDGDPHRHALGDL